MTKRVLELLYQRFQASTLPSLIGDRLFPVVAPNGTAVPFVVYDVDVDVETHLRLEFAEAVISFDVYATTVDMASEITDAIIRTYRNMTVDDSEVLWLDTDVESVHTVNNDGVAHQSVSFLAFFYVITGG